MSGIYRPITSDTDFERQHIKCDHTESAIDETPSGITLVDEKGIVLFVNKLVATCLGRPESECIGQSVQRLFPKSADVILERVKAVFTSGQSKTYETKTGFPDDSTWLLTIYLPVFGVDRAIHAVQILSLDISQEKQTQLELFETKRFLNESQRIAKLGSWTWDLGSGEITWSDELYRIYDADPNERNFAELARLMVHPDDLPHWDDQIMRALKDKTPFNQDYRIIRRDGKVMWVHSQSEMSRWDKDKVTKVWGITQDITERVLAEKQRAELEDKLRQSQKMEAIGTLAGGIAHDFNNILYAVTGFIELAMDDTESDTLAHDNLKEAFSGCLRAKELVRHILTFSRQTEITVAPVQVSSIVKETARMMRAIIPATIDLEAEDLSENSTIMGNAAQLHQVILNLCTNAAHAMEEEGGIMKIRLENTVITTNQKGSAAGSISENGLRLIVSDNGVGIKPETIDRIFEPYMTTKKNGKGTGLGLAVVHGIVKSHNGCISVKSVHTQGTTMEIVFPLIEKKNVNQTLPVFSLSTGNEHLLLVDDESQIIKFQKQALEKLGYTVSGYTDSIEAFQYFKANPDTFDAVITDMTMPNMTGELLAKRIKSIRSDIPVIVCTGYSEKISENRAEMDGIDLVLMKPINKFDLEQNLRKLLDRP